ncbi:MAG TPA: SGNH/GDSL hydrolase family protein [Opitutaceae bacterium]|nr:SGNH/GDSL hydrolase family protein [Opitutaceae bacterium]
MKSRFLSRFVRASAPRFATSVFAAAALASAVVLPSIASAVTEVATPKYQPMPDDPYFAIYHPRLAPEPGPLLLRKGDKLVIIGDSITEQKLYCRILETYLRVCRPDLELDIRQLGWSGETVEGFRKRVEQDCLRFHPDVATLCYGMNDSKYRPYDDANGTWFRENLTALVEQFKGANMRVVVGSPGIAENHAVWVKPRAGTLEEHNLNLCTLRDIALDVATAEDTRFADVFLPMLKAGFTARARYGANPDAPYALAGKDGIHPGWAGHLVMAYAFLRGLGVGGDQGTFTVDMSAKKAEATPGHHVDRFNGSELVITSSRYPFCAEGPVDRDDSIRSGMSLVPFAQEFNRLRLVIHGSPTAHYSITWGDEFRQYSAAELEAGVNLAEEFPKNPFSAAFAKVDEAVAAKQAFETKQVKQIFHGPEGKANIEEAVARTEAERAKLVQAIKDAFVPVTHTIKIAVH